MQQETRKITSIDAVRAMAAIFRGIPDASTPG
jgi:hypothetical protein